VNATPSSPAHWALYAIQGRYLVEYPKHVAAWRAIQADSQAMSRAIRAVLDHHSLDCDGEGDWPCATVQRINEALGVDQ
jgi:hypothetical protein